MATARYEQDSADLREALAASARKRWAVLLAGIAVFAGVFVFAGVVRTPGASKNPHMVLASRALAVAGILLLARIALLAHEDGVPVLLVEARGPGDDFLAGALGLIEKRFEVVPPSDVTAFVADGRYVPRRAAAVVVYIRTGEDIGAVEDALGGRAGTGTAPVALLLAEAAVDALGAGSRLADLPGVVAYGLDVDVRGLDEGGAEKKLLALAGRLRAATGKGADYAMLWTADRLDLARVGKAAGIKAFFGGDGLNRNGDRATRLRVVDVTRLLASGGARGLRLGLFAGMYRGNYLAYPAWALLGMLAGGKR